MKTFGKILLFSFLALAVLHLFPILLVPVMLGLAALLVIGTVLVGVLAAVLGTGLSLVAGILAVLVVLLAVLSPLWLPALAIYGLVKLCSRNRKVAA